MDDSIEALIVLRDALAGVGLDGEMIDAQENVVGRSDVAAEFILLEK